MRLVPSKRFSKAIAKLPRDKREAVLEALNRFIANPRAPGLNFEKLTGLDLYSLRVNLKDRIIMRRGEDEDVFLLHDVGPHDTYTRLR